MGQSPKFTHEQLRQLTLKYQGVMSSTRYNAGKWAYAGSVAILGFMSKKVLPVTAAGMGLFGQTYFSKIQTSANNVARAYALGGSRTLTILEYKRPANGEIMLLIK